ncbi:response regulator [Streptosporangium saharense]|uniref:DNA-binding NarL/FixJ family response regulator n=1 Tax=Streptosporangium saharense TaxID=1706840 RepID=A0A7W7VMB5_9ACTN|nr:response regulator transcription factor [Streptosporangium saharense]MBB4915616.1 DNA-binding NarL/FixJ family response regulator [Streptosporangium saharense]
MTIRLLIADDESLLRLAFRMVLEAEPDMEVAGEAGEGEEAAAMARRLRPDVVLMDVRMPGLDGIEATRRIVRDCPRSRVLILTTFDLDEYAFAGLKAGAAGFLPKNTRPVELLSAIRNVAAGEAVLSPRVTRRLLERFASQLTPGAPERDERLAELTSREYEVLVQVARGLSNAEAAVALHLAEATVKTHLSRVLLKLGLRSRAQVVVFAYENGIVRPSTFDST